MIIPQQHGRQVLNTPVEMLVDGLTLISIYDEHQSLILILLFLSRRTPLLDIVYFLDQS